MKKYCTEWEDYNAGTVKGVVEYEGDEVPHGNMFEVDMNGISHARYLENTERYKVVGGKLVDTRENDRPINVTVIVL